jgi:hypothetical protein
MQTTVELGQKPAGTDAELLPARSGAEPALGTAELASLRQRVARTAHPCGCKSGAIMVIAALVVWPAWRIWSGVPHSVAGAIGALAAWAGVILASALGGKVGGIVVGRWRHKRLRQQLRQALAGTTGGN